MASPLPDAPRPARGPLPRLTGFENHGGMTTVGPRARPLARVERGVGNGGGDGTEGAWSGRVLGTYLHGPLLARNTALADLLLGWAVAGTGSPSDAVADPEPLDDYEELALRAERLEAVDGLRSGSPWSHLRARLGAARR